MVIHEYKQKQGGAGSEGVDFQLNLLTVVLLNTFERHKRDRWKNRKKWQISTENEDAGVFDDVVLQKPDGDILIQAKTRKTKNIRLKELLSTKNDDFSLCKYFLSYQEITSKFKVKNVVICTNTNVQKEVLKYMNLIEDDYESALHCNIGGYSLYKFNENIRPLLYQNLKNKSERDCNEIFFFVTFFLHTAWHFILCYPL